MNVGGFLLQDPVRRQGPDGFGHGGGVDGRHGLLDGHVELKKVMDSCLMY